MWVGFHGYAVVLSAWLLSSVADCRKYKSSKNLDHLMGMNYAKLSKLTAEEGVIRSLGPWEFQDLFVKEPRNYSGFVLFNTQRLHCQHCRLMLKNVRDLSSFYTQSLEKKPETNRVLFFLEVLEDEEPEILRMVGLGPANLPTLFYFPSQGTLEGLEELEMGSDSAAAPDLMELAEWILRVSNIHIEIRNNSEDDEVTEARIWEYLTKYIAVALFICNLMKYATTIYDVVVNQTSTFFGVVVIVILCYFTSGHTFNHINNVPIVAKTSSGFYFIHPETSGQFGAESFFILCLYCVMTASTIIVIEVQKPGGKGLHSWHAKVATIAALSGFNIILRIFNGKLEND